LQTDWTEGGKEVEVDLGGKKRNDWEEAGARELLMDRSNHSHCGWRMHILLALLGVGPAKDDIAVPPRSPTFPFSSSLSKDIKEIPRFR
jgi:hypothetical protein